MNMEEEIVSWNLRGPKRMRKRKELNALVKNNARYKTKFRHNSTSNMFNMNSNSGASRLLKSNESSSDNDDYYFAANKQILKEKRRRSCCKLIQMTVIGFIIAFAMIVGITFLLSYSKFNEALTELKNEFQSQRELTKLSLTEIKRKLNEYDELYKKDSNSQSVLSKKSVNNETRLARSIRSIDLTNRLNSYLIEYIFNNSNSNPNSNSNMNQNNFKAKKTLFDLIIGQTYLKNTKNNENFNFNNYNNLVNYFHSKNKNDISKWFLNQNLQSEPLKSDLLNNIDDLYIKPILESLKNCSCYSRSKV